MRQLKVAALILLLAIIIHSNSYDKSEARTLAYMSYIAY